MKAVVFTTLLLLAATASAVLTEADRASVWNVDFSGSCYDAESHTTTFTYTATVTCNSIDEPIHYLVLEAAEDCVSGMYFYSSVAFFFLFSFVYCFYSQLWVGVFEILSGKFMLPFLG